MSRRKEYTIDQLKDDAKKRALEHMRNNPFDYPDGEENAETLKEFEGIFPVEVRGYDYGYCSNVDFRLNLRDDSSDEIEALTHVRLRTWLINNFYKHVMGQKRYYNGKKVRVSNIFTERDCCPLTGWGRDYDILKPFWDFIDRPGKQTLHDVMNDCLWGWLRACEEDYEWHYSDECLTEDAIANEIKFYKEGDPC